MDNNDYIEKGKFEYDNSQIKFVMKSDDIELITKNFAKILEYSIKGIHGIEKVNIKEIQNNIISNGKLIEDKNTDDKHYEMRTIGSNIVDIATISLIDMSKTYSNNIWEMYALYGVEVARKCLIKEFDKVLNGDVSQIQCILLGDTMTHSGILISIDRHGLGKTRTGPLGKATFEESVPQLISASVNNEIDNMNGVSANIMFGQFIKSGTNISELILNVDKLIKFNNTYTKQASGKKINIINGKYNDSLLITKYKFY
jgi:DNA-directed RNA polymerase II subunit RPB1